MRYFDPKALQRALNAKLGMTPPLKEDGILGPKTADAIRRLRTALGKDSTATIDPWLLDTLGLPDKAPKLTLSTLIGLVGPVLNLVTKGRMTMSIDQIGGVVRAILAFLAGLAVARGWVDNESAMTIVGALVTIVTTAWSLHTNRPSKIVPK